MKILFYTGGLNKGGAERVITNLCNYLNDKHEVAIMTDFNRKAEYNLEKNIKIYPLDKSAKVSKFKIVNNIIRLRKICKIVKQIKPNIILSFLPTPSYRVLLLKKFLKTPIISSVRNDPNQEYNSKIKKKIAIKMYSKADGMVFQTEDAKKWFPQNIQDKSIIIPNPINPDFIGNPYDGRREKTIVTVGRLSEQKNQKLLIDAFSDIIKEHDEYVLKIYGEGSLRKQLESQINDLDLNNKVLLMGKTDDVKKEIYKAGMFVLPSNYEGMPNALMEAMALGLPCISTDCPIGGSKFLIKNKENGILTQVNNKEEMVNAIKYLIENKDDAKKMGDNANKICQDLNPDKINGIWETYIKSVIE